ncbi:MAG: DUF87 domain-containing protein [Rhodothermales bacterium]|nr:DUF87 domain-containing protein [Rhodothermales bacterium]
MAQAIQVPDGRLFLGGSPEGGASAPVFIKTGDLTTHGVIVGMTGSGKTGLGIVLLEEVLLSGRPALILDPKGDMGNLLLAFPELAGADFLPWVSKEEAEKAGKTPEDFADGTAQNWRDGLASWGILPERVKALREKAEFTLYTPGSTAGVPMNIVGSLQAPKTPGGVEIMRDEIEGFVSSLLALVGVTGDPISSREHILLANLIEHAWNQGQDLDLAMLVGQILNPPMRKLGVIELDAFFPEKDRRQLAMRINGLLASPSFSAWMEGPPLDIDALLFTPERKPRAAILSLGHLSDDERQFVVTLVLAKLITWMRGQPGSEDLRAIVYMDEVFGFVPPTAAPPSKKPILTILKQARAFGVGMVLATQNPVDIDYKALSNTGLWMIGRLQTERDKGRLMDGLSSASGGVDIKLLDKQISGLQKRQFVLHSTKNAAPSLFTTRWAMSYLRGPMTREEIGRLTQQAPERSGAAKPAAAASSVAFSSIASTVAPDVAPGVRAYFLHPAADWRAVPGFNPRGATFAAAVAARVHLMYDDSKAGIRHTEEWEAVFHPLTNQLTGEDAIAIDYDDRDLLPSPPDGAQFVLPEADIQKPAFFKALTDSLSDHLFRSQALTIYANPKLKLFSRPGEAQADFDARCQAAAQSRADEEAAKLRETYNKRIARAGELVDKAQDQLEQLKQDHSTRKTDEMLSGVGSLLSVFLGGRKTARGIATDLRRASSKRTQTSKVSSRLDLAEDKVAGQLAELQSLEEELGDALLKLDETWDGVAREIEEIAVNLEKSDIRIASMSLVWVPV